METETPQEVWNLYPGMMIEVLTLDNKLTFVGKAEKFQNGTLTIVESRGQEVPPVLYNKEIKLRCFQGEKTLVLQGQICGSSKWLWKVDRLESKFKSEKRSYFRQHVDLETKARCVRHAPPKNGALPKKSAKPSSSWAMGKIMDVSAGGLLLNTREPYEAGDKLSIVNVSVVKEVEAFNFNCVIQRVVAGDAGTYLCGCKFEGLTSKEQDRLLRAIFIAQRKEIQHKKELGEE
ncbi:MAG: PilZ domain-containing protein [Oscillospiraceae bacterium]|nr:PilZ domain-containing protein [Oscillospiraceae bacterium]